MDQQTRIDKLEAGLDAANRIITKLNPLAGIVTTTAGFVVQLMSHSKEHAAEVEAYEKALIDFKAYRAELAADIDAFNAKYGAPAAPIDPTDQAF